MTHVRARERAARVSHVSSAVALRIPEDPAAVIHGHVAMSFHLTTVDQPLVVDFAPDAEEGLALVVNGHAAAVAVSNGHFLVPADLLLAGANTLTCDFVAGSRGLHRQDSLLYSLFVPDKASSVFPCFDQPDIKVRWTLTLEVPSGWRPVSNGRETGRSAVDMRETFVFAETPPLPTYLLAFAAGRFAVDVITSDSRTFRLFHREMDAARVQRNRSTIAHQHASALAWLEDYTGIAYPFETFDIVLIPSFQFGGMEHPGATYYNADLLMLDESATPLQELSRANVIAHETSHMWFGNLVTMTWFDDVWMKEVFASFLAAKIVNPWFPAMNHDLRFLLQHYPGAYDVDRTAGAHPIQQPLDSLTDAGLLYGPIIYLKAPIALRQLELLIGEDALRTAVREYLLAYAFGNASWTELLAILRRCTSHDIDRWSRSWVQAPGRPTIRVDWTGDSTTGTVMTVHQTDPRGRSLCWPQRVQVLLGYGRHTQAVDVTLEGASVSVIMPGGLARPEWALTSGGGLAYGHVALDPDTATWLAASAHTLEDPTARASALLALWDAMLDGQLPPDQLLETLLSALAVETDSLVLQLLLTQVRSVFWRFIPADRRHTAAVRLERVLTTGLSNAADISAKAVWFGALRSMAFTSSCVEWLEAVWARVRYIDGLPLSDTDEAALTLDLAIRLPDRATRLIAVQVARIADAERSARLAFIAPVLSPDVATRTRFFESLSQPSQRTREHWVLDAMRCLHHPIRASESKSLVRPALALVRDIQRTGDIFFPKRWVEATLDGHQSRDVAADVKDFIETLPDSYPARLRSMLLSAADPLFRASRLLDR